jgi:hypothetical protein
MPSLRCATTDPRPRLREKDPPALSAQQNSLLNKPRLLPAHLPKTHERRAPKLLHVGRRISAIQGRRAGEWLEQHRSASVGRDTARARAHSRRCVDLVRRGGRRASPRAVRASSSIAESACLTHKRLLVRVQPRPSQVAEAQPVERPPETRRVAGSTPAGHIRSRSSTR